MIYEIYSTQTLFLSHSVKTKTEAYKQTFQTIACIEGSCSNRRVDTELCHRKPDTHERTKQNAKSLPAIQRKLRKNSYICKL